MALQYDKDGNVIVPPGWQPKSAYFREAFARGALKAREHEVALACPHCGRALPLKLTIKS